MDLKEQKRIKHTLKRIYFEVLGSLKHDVKTIGFGNIKSEIKWKQSKFSNKDVNATQFTIYRYT